MAVTAYPMNASGGAPVYTARQGRQAMAALMMPGAGVLRARSGFRPGGAPAVSVDASTWSVGPWSGVVNADVSGVQAPYLCASDATDTGPMTPADGTFARKDILYVQIDDTDEDASGQRRARVLYLAGTAASTPSVPATPARSLLVGTIDVPKVGSGSPAFTASGFWSVAAGGVTPFSSAAGIPLGERYVGQLFYRTDLDELQAFSVGGTRTVWAASQPVAPWAWSAGSVSWSGTLNSLQGVKAGDITFPAGRFSQVPLVVAGLTTGIANSYPLVPRVLAATTTTAQVWLYNPSATNVTTNVSVAWHAVQMTSGSASG